MNESAFDQSDFEVRCEWGENGVAQLASKSDVVVIVDVFSFSTCVEIATHRGAIVHPYRWRDETAVRFAASLAAELAGGRGHQAKYSLSPQSLLGIPSGTRLVLPSPNGATLALGTGDTPTLAGCLRNYRAVALAARKYGKCISVIPAGERWSDGSLRPAWEDWIGAGAILSQLNGSPEAHPVNMDMLAMRPVLGEDHIPYDLESNRQTIEALIRFCVDQHIIPQSVEMEELFPNRVLNVS